ncbi:ABC transporter permease [Celeribacter neptunius]|uniref:ABC-2 type transport system permease protein n=1 Tax=Celeribacter neptunius TaxID=588602 RepID=A0A1I3N7A6_9RHOB|nr:ABC transporter permease [Celeribacter neptunius]SFJ05143.1 ABC-2 type transport system permease protein [Celeribacter neptunius]
MSRLANIFAWSRFYAVLVKEFIQMRRDRVTFGMMIGVPLMQLLLFGYAIDTDPHNLPTLIEVADESPVVRSLTAAMDTSDYFDFIGIVTSEAASDEALKDGTASVILTIPPGFEADLIRGVTPELLLTVDASDPVAAGGAIGAMSGVVETAIGQSLNGPLSFAAKSPAPFDLVIHRAFNPSGETSLNIVPGLLAVILSMTMVLITAVAIVRESEKGTMESLIATPVTPSEVMLGKILPYVFVGYVQTAVFLLAARALFSVPFSGSFLAFFLGFNLYIIVNLAIGFLVSTVARTQMQAMQLSFFTILPTILLSGFMFPFAAMPGWAQAIGTAIPATHFLRLVRKVMLKGGGLAEVTQDMAAIAVILLVVVAVALKRYRQTLD